MQKKDKKNVALPLSGVVSPFHIEIDKAGGGVSLSCNGVKGITEFSDAEIKLKLSTFSLEIEGKNLYMTVFEDTCVEIIGKIGEVRFIYAKT